MQLSSEISKYNNPQIALVEMGQRFSSLKKLYHFKSDEMNGNISFEFTKDPGLLCQYYNIRERELKSVYYAPNFNGAESEYDRNGHVLIARMGNFCIGGARLFISSPRRPTLLPLEINDFRVDKYFPELKQKEMTYGQVSWLSFLPQFDNDANKLRLIQHLFRKASASGVEKLFAVSPIANSMTYKNSCVDLGFFDTKIHFDIETPSYPSLEEVKLYLASSTVEQPVSSDIYFYGNVGGLQAEQNNFAAV